MDRFEYWLLIALLLLAFGVVGNADYEDALRTENAALKAECRGGR